MFYMHIIRYGIDWAIITMSAGDRDYATGQFHIFAHGPFATNIHLDAVQLENLKLVLSQRPLWVKEYYVLKSISEHRKTKLQLFKELKNWIGKISFSDVSSAVRNLEIAGFIHKEPQLPNSHFLKAVEANRVVKSGVGATTMLLRRSSVENDTGIFSKNLFSITQQGKEKLANSYNKDYYNQNFGIDIDELTDKPLSEFWKDISLETNIEFIPMMDQLPIEQHREKENYFFGDEDRPVLLAKFRLSNFPSNMCLTYPKNLEIHLRFGNNVIDVYGSGVGLFSSTITVEYRGSTSDISNIRDELEVSIKKVIQNSFKKNGSEEELKRFYDWIKDKGRFRLVPGFGLELAKTSKLAWIHLIYWFYGTDFLECSSNGPSIVNNDMRGDFINLLEQIPENMSFMRDRFVFYGWGRSLILTKNVDENAFKWVQDRVDLVETGQFACFGHILIDHMLGRKLSRLVLQGPKLDDASSNLKKRIEDFDKMKSAILAYIEEFRSGINIILFLGETSLVNTLENQWRLEKLRESIRNKIKSIDNERLSIEQALLNEKQDRTNKIVLAFTIMGIASVTSAIVTLSPLSDWIKTEHHFISLLTEIFFFIITTIAIISLTIILVTKWKEITRWIRTYKETKLYHNYMKKINGARNLTSQETISLLRREVNGAYTDRKITRSHHKRLIDRIEWISTRGNYVPSR
jgi:hypothetical protein